MTPIARSASRRHRILRIVTTLLILSALSVAAEAQNRQGRQRPNINPIERHLYAPELVMAHQDELALTTEQRQTLVTEVQSLQSDVVPLQFELGEVVEDLSRLLKDSPVNEATAVSHIARITDLEGKIKRRHLVLLVRIKNLLDADQLATLRRLRGNRMTRPNRK